MIWPHPVAAAARVAESNSGFHWDLGDVATWALAVLALGALIAAIKAYRKQSSSDDHLAEQVKTQGEALDEQRKATKALADQAEAQRLALEDQQAVNAIQARLLERNLNALVRQQAEQILIARDRFGSKSLGMESESGNLHVAKVINESARPIRDIGCRLQTSQDSEMLPPKLTGQISSPFEYRPDEYMARFIEQSEYEMIRLVRAGRTGAFVFAVDLNSQAILTLRFTDDAGLHWQVDNDLHLEQLGSRDDW